ncbi:MAG TPA: TIGR04290 family methyltransferase [Bryobacteraceae bacterium]|nr:TIGR04290 family methyltransferase [Bryobacteraceae bacterium]
MRDLGQWFHNLDLGGVQTAPDHFLGDYPQIKWTSLAPAIPADLRGATVLDIGCNGGFFSIQMKRRGAARVVGIDTDSGYLEQARFAAEVCGVDLELRCMSVYEIAQLREKFDWVVFMGVLYHLRYPLLALDRIREHVFQHRMIFQSMLRGADRTDPVQPDYPFSEEAIFNLPGYPKLHFVERCYSGDPTNWWIPNRACVEAMLRSANFEILSHPEREIYICR